MATKTLKTSFVIEPEIVAEARALGISPSKAARQGIIDAIKREKKFRELIGE